MDQNRLDDRYSGSLRSVHRSFNRVMMHSSIGSTHRPIADMGCDNSIINAFSFLLSVIYPSKLIWSGFGIVGTRLYANTLLAALNSRDSLSKRGMHTFGTTEFSAWGSQQHRPRAEADRGGATAPTTVGKHSGHATMPSSDIIIEMKTVTEVMTDSTGDLHRDKPGLHRIDCIA
ncbi:hypothetical protein C8Q80DRAFT_410676 [Daedaleopsis nitida]|nr:hypothetical protein C8Q80DRAFT_410676 [Daedaleopsis nitida]